MLRRLHLSIRGQCSLQLPTHALSYVHPSPVLRRGVALAHSKHKGNGNRTTEIVPNGPHPSYGGQETEMTDQMLGLQMAARRGDPTFGIVRPEPKPKIRRTIIKITKKYGNISLQKRESAVYDETRRMKEVLRLQEALRKLDPTLLIPPEPKACNKIQDSEEEHDEFYSLQAEVRREHQLPWVKDVRIKRIITLESFLSLRPVRPLSPPQYLAQYLDEKDDSIRQQMWAFNYHSDWRRRRSLLSIFLEYLGQQHNLGSQSAQYLLLKGFTVEDLASWESILSEDNADQMARRFCKAFPRVPNFVLLEILRRELKDVESLQMLLPCVWNMVRGMMVERPWALDTIVASIDQDFSQTTTDGTSKTPQVISYPQHFATRHMDTNPFMALIDRLLCQARRIWPPAVVSIAHLVSLHIRTIVAVKSLDLGNLNGYHHQMFCYFFNSTMHKLARAARAEPFKSMIYNWTAQKVLLELAREAQPALLLDQDSYRAIIAVLGGLKKSKYESKSSTLRARTWPPWRVYQDGMDAESGPEHDHSKVAQALARMKEAGYNKNSSDDVMSIIGGLEPDGTPTIQQRKFMRPLRNNPKHLQPRKALDLKEWAARMHATRDIREAWGAFIQFKKQGGSPSPQMYLAMFEKLNAESRRCGRQYTYEAAPGDGKEVLPVPEINFSADYLEHHQPPSWDALYDDMLRSKIKPAGLLLKILVKHARTISCGFQYLKDSGVDPRVLRFLRSSPGTLPDPQLQNEISEPLLNMFTTLLCRFAPRAISTPPINGQSQGSEHATPGLPNVGNEHWQMKRLIPKTRLYEGLSNPLYSVAVLLNLFNPGRSAWYQFFRALNRQDVIVVESPLERTDNHVVAWQIMRATFTNFLHHGHSLDPAGFHLICSSFARFAEASRFLPKEWQAPVFEDAQILKEEFSKLSAVTNMACHLPKLLYAIRGQHLHTYIRALSFIEDRGEVLQILTWMVENESHLKEISEQDRNGYEQYRKAMVNVRACCGESEAVARELVESVAWWGGWPDDVEVEKYFAKVTGILSEDP